MKKHLILATSLLSFSSLAFSAEWTSNAELGLVLTSGNTETETGNVKINVVREVEKWKNSVSFEALGSSTTDITTDIKTTTAEKYSANLQSNYKFNSEDYMFGAAAYDDDRFSGYEFQAIVSAGYGRNLVKTEKHSLSAEAGPGMRLSKLSPDPVLGPVPSENEGIIHFAANYAYQITETSKFTQELIIDAGEDLTTSESVSALRAQVSGKLAMKASIKVRNSSEVPPENEKTDTESALTLVYSLL